MSGPRKEKTVRLKSPSGEGGRGRVEGMSGGKGGEGRGLLFFIFFPFYFLFFFFLFLLFFFFTPSQKLLKGVSAFVIPGSPIDIV